MLVAFLEDTLDLRVQGNAHAYMKNFESYNLNAVEERLLQRRRDSFWEHHHHLIILLACWASPNFHRFCSRQVVVDKRYARLLWSALVRPISRQSWGRRVCTRLFSLRNVGRIGFWALPVWKLTGTELVFSWALPPLTLRSRVQKPGISVATGWTHQWVMPDAFVIAEIPFCLRISAIHNG